MSHDFRFTLNSQVSFSFHARFFVIVLFFRVFICQRQLLNKGVQQPVIYPKNETSALHRIRLLHISCDNTTMYIVELLQRLSGRLLGLR